MPLATQAQVCCSIGKRWQGGTAVNGTAVLQAGLGLLCRGTNTTITGQVLQHRRCLLQLSTARRSRTSAQFGQQRV